MNGVLQVKRSEASKGLFLVAVSAVLWGTLGVATKLLYGMTDTNPLSIGFFRLALASPFLVLFCLRSPAVQAETPKGNFRIATVFLGISLALFQVSYFAAVQQLGVVIAVLLTSCTAPVLVAALSAGLLRERLTLPVVKSLLFAVTGTVFLVGISNVSTASRPSFWGGCLALLAPLATAGVTLSSRALSGHPRPLMPITISLTLGAALLLPFCLLNGMVLRYPVEGWALLFYAALGPTALAYILYLRGMRHVPPTVASIVTLLEPLVSTVLAWGIFGERLNSWGLVGAALLFYAMYQLFPRAVRSEQPSLQQGTSA